MTVKTTRRFFLFNLILCWVFLSFKSGFAGDYNCQEGTCTAINYNLEDSTFGGEESNNKLILSEGSTANNITITTNGEAVIEDTTTATEFLVTMTGTSGNPGSVTIETGGKGEKFTIENGGKVIVDGGSLVGDNKIAKGGSILVKKDGTASNITAVDGFIEIQDGAVVNNVTLTGNGELDINIGHRNSGYESSTPTLNTVKVQEGSTLKLYNSGSGGDVDNVVIEGKLVSNIENGGNYTSFNASNVEIKKTGSFELSTNDTIDSLVVEDDTARSPGVIAAKKASDILVKNE